MDKIESLPLSALRESPFNPRQSYPQAKLEELAESIKAQGVMQPIVARPLPGEQGDLIQAYEIVFGHRRFRAASIAGLEFIPAIVREMDNRQASIAQLHENDKREDVKAYEEADTFARLMREFGMSADDIAAEIKKSRSYVYARLKLSRSAPEVRHAVNELGLAPEIALYLSRLTTHDEQRAKLKDLRDYHREKPNGPPCWISVALADERIKAGFIRIADAGFDTTDATLCQGAGACTNCPRLSGNSPDLAALPPDLCLDRGCYKLKTEAHERRRADAIRASAAVIVEGDEAKQRWTYSWRTPEGLISLDEEIRASKGDDADDDEQDEQSPPTLQTLLAGLGEAAPQATYIAAPGSGRLEGFLSVDDANKVMELAGAAHRFEPQPTAEARREAHLLSIQQEREAEMADWTAEERLAVSDSWTPIRDAVLARFLTAPRTVQEMRMALWREIDLSGDCDFGLIGKLVGLAALQEAAEDAADGGTLDLCTWTMDWINTTATPDQLAALLVGPALVEKLMPGRAPDRERAGELLALARAYGVNPADYLPKPVQADLIEDAAPLEPSSPLDSAAQAQGKKAGKPAARYVNAATGETWSGRGLQPAWLKKAIREGARLEDFDTTAPTPSPAAQAQVEGGEEKTLPAWPFPRPKEAKKAKQPAGSAGEKVKVEAGGLAAAGGAPAAAEAGEEAVA